MICRFCGESMSRLSDRVSLCVTPAVEGNSTQFNAEKKQIAVIRSTSLGAVGCTTLLRQLPNIFLGGMYLLLATPFETYLS